MLKRAGLLLNIIVAFSVVLALLPGQVQATTIGSGTASGPQPPDGPKSPQSLSQTPDPAKSLFPPADNGGLEAALQRVDPELRQIARQGGDQLVKVSVLVKPGADLGRYFEKLIVNPGKDFDRLTGMVKASSLVKLATASGTLTVLNMGARPAPDIKKGNELADGQGAPERLQKSLEGIKAERTPQKSTERLVNPQAQAQPQSFFTNDANGVKQTWAEGVYGDGDVDDPVKLAIVDTGVDFANPDLIGTAARVTDPNSAYFDTTGGFGWPIAFDDRSMSDYALDNQDYRGNWGWYMNTNTDVNVWSPSLGAFVPYTGAFQDPDLGSTVAFTFTVMHPDYGVPFEYIVDSPVQVWNTNGGWYRFGWHPDDSLASGLGETPGVLVSGEDYWGTDWGMFDTIYVDILVSYWFDASYPFNAWADLGYEVACVNLGWSAYPNCDLSGGMIYYISNGSTPVPASDWMYGLGSPAAGEVVAFMLNDFTENGGEHGTLCAGTAVGQGVIDEMPYSGYYGSTYWPPTWYDPDTMGISEGPGKLTGLVAMGNYYAGGSSLNFYDFAALGYDGLPAGATGDTHDQPHMLSNSYGSGSVDNDGWDFSSRYQTLINYGYIAQHDIDLPDDGAWSPLFFKSAGNSGFGYGTVNVPQPESAVVVGASGVYGQFNLGDNALYPEWVNWGQLTGMSDRGPSSMSTLGMHVLTNGMFGSGNLPLNYFTGGDWAVDFWAGTSRSSPEAAGITALIFDAYYEQFGSYPSWQEARTLLMNGARTGYNDPFAQGAGLANAYGSYQVINGGRPEIMTDEGSGYWIPGSYRDETYPSFARGLLPGESDTTGVVIQNNGDGFLFASLEAVTLEMYESREWDFTSLPLDQEGPSTRYYDRRLFGPAGSNTGFGGPDPLFIEGVDDQLLAEADMMVVRMSHPFEQFENDVVGNWWFLYAWAWRDQPYEPSNAVGTWFKDGNDNHVRNSGEFDAPSETVRMIYDYHGNTAEIRIREPWDLLHGYTWPGEPDLAPMDDILISLRHFYYGGYDTTDLKVTIELYKEVPWDQIELEVPYVNVYPYEYEWIDVTAVTSWKDDEILPLESFENYAPPTGWSVYDMDGGDLIWEPLDLSTFSIFYGDNLAHTGNEVYRHRSYSEYGYESVGMQEGWLVTPPVDLHDGSTLRFYDLTWYDPYYYYGESEFSVKISTGSCDPQDGEYETLDTWWGYNDWWEEKLFNLSEYDGQTACIAFVYRGYESNEWWIDDVEVFSQTFDPPGEYTGYIKATYGAMPNEVVYLPVQKQVWFPSDIDPVLGGFEAGTLYENGVMFGGTGTADAQRAESGDWRFFYT
ncbi:MAG: S8 family serine peptidase, partial [Anaerolineales bacterium]|nr:S8 family serine peptidase [Anaerolineales bacterium]